uniref:Apolipoprotein F n=1 Tax=Pipistrellus kuhlii TaxID=59472 RepID=A0A7J7ZGT6_PIPKU|nr:apolipoprotein F [Pipistrellus kuhlii]
MPSVPGTYRPHLREAMFLVFPSPVYSGPDMGGLRLILPLELLLSCCLLLHPVDAMFSANQTDTLMHLPSSLESWPPSSGPLPCQTLLPKSLPGFAQMAPLPQFLVGLSLMIALKEAGCRADAQALQLQLHRQGGIRATQILTRHLQRLEKGRDTERGVSVDALASALQLLTREQLGPERARRSLSQDCDFEQEQEVYDIVRWVPTVGTYYNLGTALFYATHDCLDKAKERGQDGIIDLGYDLLTTMAGLTAGPMGLVFSAALKPVVKAGVQRLTQNYHV